MKQVILVVDDDPDIRRVLEAVLSREYRVVTASEGRHALAAFKKCKPDLTMLDIALPDMDGLDVLKALLKSDPKAVVVMLSGNQELAVARQAMKLGACDYISKPYAAEHVRDVIAERLRPSVQGPGGAAAR